MVDEPTERDWARLGLAPGVSREALEEAYRRRRALYDGTSLATYSLYSDEERQAHLVTLEASYRRLLARFPAASAPPPPSPAQQPAVELTATPAGYLKRLRELRGLSLADISQRTKIRPAILAAIEAEDVTLLPAPVYVRGFVLQIAKLLEAPDPEGLARRYLARLASRRGQGAP